MNHGNGALDVIPLRIGILMDHPSPHMVGLLNAIANREDCAAKVIYCGKSAPERGWGAPTSNLSYLFLKGITVSGGFRMNPDLVHVLRRIRVDAWVINSVYTSPSTLIAAWWLGQGSIPWVYMNEPPRPRHSMLSAFKYLLLRFVSQRTWGIIGMGRKAEEMYRIFLRNNQSTTSVPYYIDLENFLRLPILSSPIEGRAVKFITSGQMIKRKGLDTLLHACELLPDNGWELTLAGNGPLRNLLEKEYAKRWDNERVRFIGEIPYENRSSVFQGKHVFVFPSRWDGWGMVVPEALAAGLPVISTDQVISAHEFIKDGENGFIIPAEDSASLANKMEWFIHNKETIQAMGTAARKGLENYRAELGADELVQFLSRLVNNRRKSFPKNQDLELSNSQTWENLTGSSVSNHQRKDRLRSLAKNLMIRGNLAAKSRLKPNGHRILVYHLVLMEDKPRFEEHLKLLTDHFRVSLIPEIFQSVINPRNGDAPCVAITFDDGFGLLMEECLELLEKYGIKAYFHVPTKFVELSYLPDLAAEFCLRSHHYHFPLDPMQPKDLKLLTDLGHHIGSHGVSHISLGLMTKRMAKRELDESRKKILGWTGKEPASFAYPYGEIENPLGKTTDWVRDAGYQFALTLRRGKIGETTDPFLIPREHIEGNWPIDYLKYFLFS